MLDLYAQVRNGRLEFQPPSDKLFMRLLSECEGKFVRVQVSRRGPMKTNQQVKAHWGLAVAMIRQAMMDHGWDICGVAPTKDMIHEILLKCCGGVGPIGASLRLSEMTIDQAMEFFENVRTWAATQLNINIPDPDKEWRKHAHSDES